MIRGGDYNHSTDFYAIGIMMYEMYFGETPFKSENVVELYRQILEDDIKYPKDFDSIRRNIINKLTRFDP